jgi:hypothetical protein
VPEPEISAAVSAAIAADGGKGTHPHVLVRELEARIAAEKAWHPKNWTVTLRGKTAHLSHGIADEDGPIWVGEVELWRGAPDFEDHPEIRHALLSIMNTLVHQEFVRVPWTYDIPDVYAGAENFGSNRRRYLLLFGGSLSWSLELRLPVGAPQFVWKAICHGFKATLKGE